MLKIIAPNAWKFDEPVAQMIKIGSRGRLLGIDRTNFIKRAGEIIADMLDGVKFASGEIPIHLLAVGATEFYNANRNGDGFDTATCRGRHSTFVKKARFYRDHQNRKPERSYGVVKQSAFNEKMQRIELICGLNGTDEAARRNGGLLADREMEKLARDEDIAVSMACVLDPQTLVMTSVGYKPIINIQVGDLVFTHRGRWQHVTRLHRRKYSGEVINVKVAGLPTSLDLTADHPMFAKSMVGSRKKAAVGARTAQWAKDAASSPESAFDWLHAGHLDYGDRLSYQAVGSVPGYAAIDSEPLCELLGIYVAEGSVRYSKDNLNDLTFTVHASDWAVRGVPGIFATMFPGVTVNLKPKSNCGVAFDLVVSSAELARFFDRLAGQGSGTKRVPMELFNSTSRGKSAFLGRWLDGDGWVDKKGGHWSSENYGLILQGRDLLASIEIPASIYKIDHSKCATSGYENSGIEYTLNVSHCDLAKLQAWSEKIQKSPYTRQVARRQAACLRPVGDGFAYRVKTVTRRTVVNAVTYNFEVEEDESYTLLGIGSHNCLVPFDVCSGCGHRSKSRNDYCDSIENGGHCKAGGLKHHMGDLVTLDGDIHHLHAGNPNCTFFDISNVYRPADRIAYVSGQLKAAGVASILSGAEMAEQLGLTAPYDVYGDTDNLPSNVAARLKMAYELASAESDVKLESQTLMAFDSDFNEFTPPPVAVQEKLASILRALADEKICLPLSSFLQLVGGQPVKEAAATSRLLAAQLPYSFNQLLQSPELAGKLASNPYEPAPTTSNNLRNWAVKQAENLSLGEPWFSRRASLAVLRKKAGAKPSSLVKTASPKEAELLQHYALYKLAFLTTISSTSADLALTVNRCLAQNHAN